MRTLSTTCCVAILLLIGCSENKPQPQPVSLSDLPQSVQEGFARDFPDVKIQRVERVPKPNGPDFYRLHFIGENGQQQEILYNPEGYKQTKEYDRKN